MKRVLVSPLPKLEKPSLLSEDESHHLIHVFRLKNGDTVECLDGEGHYTTAELQLLGKGKAQVVAKQETQSNENLLSLPLSIECSLLKSEAMEWVIEKSVEIGVRHFYPVETAHSVIQTAKKGGDFFKDRWQKIADQALKQCGRLDRMHIHLPQELPMALARKTENRFWLNETEKESAPMLLNKLSSSPSIKKEVTLLVGPEGGWSTAELEFLQKSVLQNTVQSISLGPWVFRAETAVLFAASLSAAAMRV